MQRPKSARFGPLGESGDSPSPPDDSTVVPHSDDLTSVAKPVFEVLENTFAPGAVVNNRYKIVRLIGFGGMGAVYEAEDVELERKVAIKTIRRDLARDPEMLRRFKQELLLARQVSHRNVVRIYDIGEADGTKFISMEYVLGRELGELIAVGPLPPSRAAGIALQILKGLAVAHTEQVIHRDLKPQNIVVSEDDRVYIMDFGIARSMEQSGLTQTGAVVGTLEYMSPEQAKGEKVDSRSDLYAFGLIFYEMLTGVSAFKGETALATLYRRINERPVPPSQVDSKIPAELSAIVVKCLDPSPQKRFQSAAEIIQAIDAWMGVSPRTDFRHSRILIPQTSIGLPRLLAVVFALLVFAGVSWYLVRQKTAVAQPHAAVTVLVGDFSNHTGDPVFDSTLEPMVNVAMEGASFVNAFNRGEARRVLGKLNKGADRLDEDGAQLVALNQNIGVVITGSISRRGDMYRVTLDAIDSAHKTLESSEISVASKDDVLLGIPRLAAPIRKALGDKTPESVQLASAAGSFSAASLAAVHEYGAAMEHQFAGDMEKALKSFAKAAELDPAFARAYSGMAAASRNLSRPEDAEKYFKQAMERVDRMTERERLRTRGAYYVTIGNYPKCVEEYSALVAKFPYDNIGHNNLGACYSGLRNWPKAMEEAKRAVELNPQGSAQRQNLALYAASMGDFGTAENEARESLKLNPTNEKSLLVLADAQMGQGKVPDALATYEQLRTLGGQGASIASSGIGDVAIYEGRYRDAVRTLEAAAADHVKAKEAEQAADKYAAVAYAHLSAGRMKEAIASANRALRASQSVKIRFLSGDVLASAGDAKAASAIAASLRSEPAPEPKVYSQLIDGEVYLQKRDAQHAIELFTEAGRTLDTWIGHFKLARAYLEARMFTEADSELDACIRRRGEVLEMMDDGPTSGYFPAVYYYRGRVRQALNSPEFAESYRQYKAIRGAAGEDPLLREISPDMARAQ
jgi:tetratricopeptide (TPR) repeat protein/predicted Ser/Thr protein kinase